MPGVDPLSIITAGAGAIQSIVGLFDKGQDKKDLNNLVSQRKAFKTPEEIIQILQATESNAGNGLGAPTLDYLTSGINKAASASQNTLALLGGDPNDAATIFSKQADEIFKVGAENHAANLQNFNRYLTALGTVAQNKEAEQISADNLLKDKIQAKSAEISGDTKNIGNGLNTVIGGLASNQQMQLFKNLLGKTTTATNVLPKQTGTMQPVFNASITVPEDVQTANTISYLTSLLKNNFVQ